MKAINDFFPCLSLSLDFSMYETNMKRLTISTDESSICKLNSFMVLSIVHGESESDSRLLFCTYDMRKKESDKKVVQV